MCNMGWQKERGKEKISSQLKAKLLYTMLNAGRNPGLKFRLLAKISGYMPKLWLNSPLQFLFRAKNRIGYPLGHATNSLAAQSRFELHLPDCDKHIKTSTARCWFLFLT